MTQTNAWYEEATLKVGPLLVRAGTLIQCARRWETLSSEDQAKAVLKIAKPLDGLSVMEGQEIAGLASRPGYRFA